VRYEIDRLDTPIGYCHCTTCRKAHTAASAPTARVTREHFHLIAGRENLSTFESSPGRVRRVSDQSVDGCPCELQISAFAIARKSCHAMRL
jgi:hypothetical protein